MDHLSPLEAGRWLARMAAADGVVSANERKLIKEFADTYGVDANALLRTAYAIAPTNDQEVELSSAREIKGRKFENFFVSLLSDKSKFSLKAWRGDKISGDIYAEENLLPDLHIKHKLDCGEVEYHVECKYRTSLDDNTLDLTSQLGRYRRMTMNIDNAEMFIAIGIGGTPSKPNQLYIIPDRMIRQGCIIKLQNFSKCLCEPTTEALHKYISHYFEKRVFK